MAPPIKEQCLRGHLRSPARVYKDGSCRDCKKEDMAARRKENPKKYSEAARVRYALNGGRLLSRIRQLMRVYGLTLEQYKEMLQSQNNKCLICKQVFDEDSGLLKPCIDHVHDETKEIRGILCNSCNRLLGLSRDNVEVLQGAIEYLKSFTRRLSERKRNSNSR